MLFWPCFLFTDHMKEMLVFIFIQLLQNRSAGNQESSDILAFTYFTLDD